MCVRNTIKSRAILVHYSTFEIRLHTLLICTSLGKDLVSRSSACSPVDLANQLETSYVEGASEMCNYLPSRIVFWMYLKTNIISIYT